MRLVPYHECYNSDGHHKQSNPQVGAGHENHVDVCSCVRMSFSMLVDCVYEVDVGDYSDRIDQNEYC